MARRPPIRVYAWLIAAFLASPTRAFVGIVADLRGDRRWVLAVRGGLLIVGVLCFVVYLRRLRRWRHTDRAGAEH